MVRLHSHTFSLAFFLYLCPVRCHEIPKSSFASKLAGVIGNIQCQQLYATLRNSNRKLPVSAKFDAEYEVKVLKDGRQLLTEFRKLPVSAKFDAEYEVKVLKDSRQLLTEFRKLPVSAKFDAEYEVKVLKDSRQLLTEFRKQVLIAWNKQS
jgi:hypothetical protein